MDPIDMLHAKVDELAIVMLNAKVDKLAKEMGLRCVEEAGHVYYEPYGCDYNGGPNEHAECPLPFDEGIHFTQGHSDQWPYQGGYHDWRPQQQHPELSWTDSPFYSSPPQQPTHFYQAPYEEYYQEPPPPPPTSFECLVQQYINSQQANKQEADDRHMRYKAQMEEFFASQKAMEYRHTQVVSSGRFEAYDTNDEYQKEEESDATFLHICKDDEIPLTKPIEEMVEQIVEQEERDGSEEVPVVKHVMEVVGEDLMVVDDIPANAKVENTSYCASLSDNPCDAPYILEFILEPKVWNMECAQYYHEIREPTRVPRAKMLLRRFPQYRWYH